MRESLRFVIVGHVDHGKSTLIGRLLYDTGSIALDRLEEARHAARELGAEAEFAFLLDHLQEEREGALTIDTAQTFFSTPKRDYVLIDAPGHVEFLKNMITGAAQADAAVLIVDASRGIEVQTRRHAYLLALLGLEEVIVALNKMDLVGYREGAFREASEAVRGLLESVAITARSYIPISAKRGDNIADPSRAMSWYRGPTLLGALDSLEERSPPQDKPLVFPIQDVYHHDGERIAVGRVEAGVLRKGDKIKLLPRGELATVDSIKKFLEEPRAAYPGESIGITLTVGSRPSVPLLERGQVVCRPGAEPNLTDRFKANVFWLAEKGLGRGERVTLRSVTQAVSARLEAISEKLDSASLEVLGREAPTLEQLEVGRVIVKTDSPVVVARFAELQGLGRFVLARGEEISAGGIITGLDGPEEVD